MRSTQCSYFFSQVQEVGAQLLVKALKACAKKSV